VGRRRKENKDRRVQFGSNFSIPQDKSLRPEPGICIVAMVHWDQFSPIQLLSVWRHTTRRAPVGPKTLERWKNRRCREDTGRASFFKRSIFPQKRVVDVPESIFAVTNSISGRGADLDEENTLQNASESMRVPGFQLWC